MNNSFLAFVKFTAAVLLLPIVWASAVVFHQFIVDLPSGYGEFFFWGMFGFVLLFIFFFQFWGIYELGQNIVAGIFQFTAPANHFIAKVVPFYLTSILLLFYVTGNLLNVPSYDYYFMFFAGFSFTMHIFLTAQELQEQEKIFIKPTYLFIMMLALILLALITVLLFNLVIEEFTFPEFVRSVIGGTVDIYYYSVKKIFFLK